MFVRWVPDTASKGLGAILQRIYEIIIQIL